MISCWDPDTQHARRCVLGVAGSEGIDEFRRNDNKTVKLIKTRMIRRAASCNRCCECDYRILLFITDTRFLVSAELKYRRPGYGSD